MGGGGGLSRASDIFAGLAGSRIRRERVIDPADVDEDGEYQCRGAQDNQEVEDNLLEGIKRRQINLCSWPRVNQGTGIVGRAPPIPCSIQPRCPR